ncbi:TonB-dependent siderophore receptor [Alcaligenaceae bacterium A4P071]|nr:TonB-dependent siderophore receptor [Alcaligenaceae bacterium A4P071]
MSRPEPTVSRPVVAPTSPSASLLPAFSLALLTGALSTGAVHAQTGSSGSTAQQLSPIQVHGDAIDGYQAVEASSPKFTAPLLDTPRSVIVVPEALMKDRGATSLQDVLRTTPGITFGAGEGGTPVGDRPFIRGYESSTDILVDGMRDFARTSHETFNLESVEVLKGPSSAYSGRGSTGGSINLVTKTPKQQNFVEIGAGIGTDDNYRTTADANWAFTDSTSFRLNLLRMGGDVPGRDHVEIDRWGVAPSLAFGMGTPTRVTLSYSHIENDDMPDLGMPFSNAARPGRSTPIRVDRDLFYGRKNVDYRNNTSDTSTARIEHDLNDVFTVRNSTRYVKTLNDYLMTRPSFDNCTAASVGPCATEGPGLQFTRDARARWRQSEAILNQTDIFGEFATGRIRHSVTAGFEISKETLYSKSVTGFPGRDTDSFYSPNPNRNYASNIQRGPKTNDGNIKSRAIYVFDTVKFSEQWEANAGLRYDNYRVTNNTDDRTDNLWNYQLGLVYKPLPNGSIYASYGTSSNPVGENLGQAGGADGPAGGAAIRDLGPEKSRSIELGTKWDVMNDRLSLTAAVFETKKTDARTFDPITGDVTLDGNNRVRGVEFGASGAITPRWNVWGGYSYLDPEVTSYRGGASAATDYSGKQIKFIAKQSVSLWTTYALTPAFTVGGGPTYVGKRFANDANTLELPSSWRYDAMAKYQVNKQFGLQLNVNNISNERIYDASHVGLFALMAPGRSAMLTATYRYE